MMLPKARRVRQPAEFDQVFRNGAAVHGRLLTLRYGPAADAGAPSAFGFVVGMRVSKSAVVRNRLKRQLRAIAATELADVVDGQRIVVIAKSAAAGQPAAELATELTRLAKKATLLR